MNEAHSTKRVRLNPPFLCSSLQMDGGDAVNDNVFLMCTTNCPWDLDSAFLRRFQKRIYVPLPDKAAREGIVMHAIGECAHSLSSEDIARVVDATEGLSGSDLVNVANDALFEPVREIEFSSALGACSSRAPTEPRPLAASNFLSAASRVQSVRFFERHVEIGCCCPIVFQLECEGGLSVVCADCHRGRAEAFRCVHVSHIAEH